MAKLLIKGKEYQIPERFTYRELSLFKRMTGVSPQQADALLRAGDPDAIAAVALICLRREDPYVSEDIVLDMEIQDIGGKKEEGDKEGPPDESRSPESGGGEGNDLKTPEDSGAQS
jgi:hypothetical protein